MEHKKASTERVEAFIRTAPPQIQEIVKKTDFRYGNMAVYFLDRGIAMYATIQKWGNSQGIRIPKSLLEALGIRENDRVELLQEQDTITIKKANAAPHKTLEERLASFYRKPIEEIGRIQSEEVDWGKVEGNEAGKGSL